MSKMSKKKKRIRILSIFLCFVAFVVLCAFLFLLYKIDVLPMKYYLMIAGGLGFLELIYILFCKNKRIKSGIMVFLDIFAIIFILIEGFASYKIYQASDFLNNNMQVKETKDIYYIVVNSDSKYEKLEDIEKEIVYYFDDGSDFKTLQKSIIDRVEVLFDKVESFSELMDDVLEDKNKIILISQSSYDAYFENDTEESETTTKVDQSNFKRLGFFELVKELKISDSTKDITTEPFIVYLSGIDTRKDEMPSKCLSDVNMFIVVNPNTRKILMVNVPRDYYVQLHGTEGLHDKLTHAGMVGGIELSRSTMEDLLGYETDYYVRVNFQAVIKLVDAVGGITINNDLNKSFRCHTDKSCLIRPGNNDVGGKCALAFARERYVYSSGDRHRGENQQQVIQLLVNKLSSSKSLLVNYEKILGSLEGSFESNLSTKNITSLVQFQINDMRGWNFETANLDGKTGLTATYSYPKSRLSVMYEDEDSIEAAKEKIKEVLEEK